MTNMVVTIFDQADFLIRSKYSNQNYRNLLYLAFDLTEGYCYYQQIGSDTGKYESVWCETYHVLLIKTITSDVKASTYIITSTHPVRLAY